MLKKYGKYYADWKDAKGHRRRRAFGTATAARKYAAQQAAAAQLKNAHRRK